MMGCAAGSAAITDDKQAKLRAIAARLTAMIFMFMCRVPVVKLVRLIEDAGQKFVIKMNALARWAGKSSAQPETPV
jgi:hypothetical protein